MSACDVGSELAPACRLMIACNAGIQQIQGYGNLNAIEKKALETAVPELKSSIEKGVAFAQGKV